MTMLLLGDGTIGNAGHPLSIGNPYEHTQAQRIIQSIGQLPTSRLAAESRPRVHLDENGWPQDFWATLGTVDQDFSLGDRDLAHERLNPVKGD